jgi:hypothetical protein
MEFFKTLAQCGSCITAYTGKAAQQYDDKYLINVSMRHNKAISVLVTFPTS